MVAGSIEAVSASQGRMTGLEVGIMGSIQVRDVDDDGARPHGTGPDVIGMGVFWMSEKDKYSSSPFSNAAELEPEGRDAEGWVMAWDELLNTSTVSWGARAAWGLDCGCVFNCEVACGTSISDPTWYRGTSRSNIVELGPAKRDAEV